MEATDHHRGKVNTILGALAHQRRRYALQCLGEYENPMALADLADEVAVRENEVSLPEISAEQVKRIYLSLYHAHIPKLEEAALVQYRQDRDQVRLVDNAGRGRELLEVGITESSRDVCSTPEDVSDINPPSADEAVARLRLKLRHRPLTELVEEGLVRWDRENHIVEKGPNFDGGVPERSSN